MSKSSDEPQDNNAIDVMSLINRKMADLNPALQRVGKYIIENPSESKSITTKQLGAACGVAESSVTRFVREVGLKSFSQLKIMLAESVLNKKYVEQDYDSYVYENVSAGDTVGTICDKLIYRNINMLKETRLLIDDERYISAAKAIYNAETIAFSCFGSSVIAAEEAVMRFTRAGKKCSFFRDTNSQLMTSAILSKKDVIIGISNSGDTVAVANALKTAQENGATAIGITAFSDSLLAKNSEITLFSSGNTVKSKSSVDAFENTTSKISQLLVIDILYSLFAAQNQTKVKKHLEKTYEAVSHTRIKN
ncbi:MAG: MurR/RpiR family transcriptional regulator [Clostridia bacterium]|jgi:RpiR family transcriptional regulator, carbohydrate utilization regulator|nr:MurR/RpiR family transcriptional regulator [Clostridia bacterium]MBT7121833.1 MurR/RpiR family transcriptional regulator [Clostridia bacterium]